MTDKEILNEVHSNAGLPKYLKDFIEQEWQREDEDKQSENLGEFSKTWYVDSNRRRGLNE